jgi:hypothetical protein
MASKIGFVDATSGVIEVSQEVIDDVEGAYAYLADNPNKKALYEGESKEEKLSWIRQARAYAASREAGALSFRILPDKAKTLGDNQMYFRLTADLPTNGQRATN